jgi:hypothetical protein
VHIQLSDALTIDAASVRETRDGYLVANARTARTGIQLYTARDLGFTDRAGSDVIRVYRPPEEVFAADALASMAYRPMTNGHPAESVSSKNWKDHSIGNAGSDIARDGDFVRVPLLMMDAGAIADFKAGKRELSWGYGSELVLEDGVVPDGQLDAGQRFDAKMTNIRCNHLALCDQARGGAALVFGDGKTPQPQETKVKTIFVDGIPVSDVSDAAEAVITRLQRQMADAATTLAASQAQVGTLTATVATKDGEIAALGAQLVDATNPATLAKAAAVRAGVITAAKPLLGDAFTGDGMDNGAIMRAAVAVKLPDAADATKFADASVEGAFRLLTAGVVKTEQRDGVAAVVRQGVATVDSDPLTQRNTAYAARRDSKSTAYLSAKAEA